MLTDLSITNIAIIDSLRIGFGAGLTVLTGETGAGKSIIIDAVGLIMGGRASGDLIRSGAEEAVVEAMFDVADMPGLRQFLEESGIECDGELLIRRSISRSGKNRIFINGQMATLALLGDTATRIVNIYGQHESQTLLRADNQLTLLDAFAGTDDLRERFALLFRQQRSLQERLKHLDEEEAEASRRIDLLAFQSGEIAAADLKPGEEEQLLEERGILANAERLGSTTGEAFERLYGGDGAILGQLKRIAAVIADTSRCDHSLSEPAAALESAYLQLEDAAMFLRDYASRIEADPDRLARIEDRLDLIARLKKKYGATAEEVLAYKQTIDADLEELNGRVMDREQLEKEYAALAEQMKQVGGDLTAKRDAAARKLKKALEAEAHQLAMKHAVIEPALQPLDEPRATGYERVEFLFSPNPGETPRPLAKIASGGELSRLMLAFKQVLPQSDVPTLIFDEVDSGIGGATSEMVGRKLKKVAGRQQVLCITHLPQVAAFADHHLAVAKVVDSGRTSTRLSNIDGPARIEEIARMLGGATITDTTRSHAAEMIAASRPSPAAAA